MEVCSSPPSSPRSRRAPVAAGSPWLLVLVLFLVQGLAPALACDRWGQAAADARYFLAESPLLPLLTVADPAADSACPLAWGGLCCALGPYAPLASLGADLPGQLWGGPRLGAWAGDPLRPRPPPLQAAPDPWGAAPVGALLATFLTA